MGSMEYYGHDGQLWLGYGFPDGGIIGYPAALELGLGLAPTRATAYIRNLTVLGYISTRFVTFAMVFGSNDAAARYRSFDT
jgi:hypothetical protein